MHPKSENGVSKRRFFLVFKTPSIGLLDQPLNGLMNNESLMQAFRSGPDYNSHNKVLYRPFANVVSCKHL